MIAFASVTALVLVSLALLMNLYRMVKGPDAVDRILALDVMAVNLIALIIVAGILLGTKLYFEAALLFAMIGFLTTVAFCKYLLRGDVIE